MAREAKESVAAAYVWAVLAVVLATGVAWQLVPHDDAATCIMVYLLAVVLVASRFGRGAARTPSWAGPSVLTSVLSVAAFDFFFVPPIFTFVVHDLRYLFTFAIMLFVALVISSLTARTKRQAEAAETRERRTAALYALTRELTSAATSRDLADVAARHVSDVFDAAVVVLLAEKGGALTELAQAGGGAASDVDAAARAFERPRRGGRERRSRCRSSARAGVACWKW